MMMEMMKKERAGTIRAKNRKKWETRKGDNIGKEE